ncbi:MAG: hypothetical protein ACRDSL_26600, partial [Pseudonocardiaceae bacterium]
MPRVACRLRGDGRAAGRSRLIAVGPVADHGTSRHPSRRIAHPHPARVAVQRGEQADDSRDDHR